jgi:hypothetical protein
MTSKHAYQSYVELLDLTPSHEPTENLAHGFAPASIPPHDESLSYLISVSVVTNLVTLCCLFCAHKCIRYLHIWVQLKRENKEENDIDEETIESVDDEIDFWIDDMYA